MLSSDKVYSHLNIIEKEVECHFIKISKKEYKNIILVNGYRMLDNRSIESRLKAGRFIEDNIKSIENQDRNIMQFSIV